MAQMIKLFTTGDAEGARKVHLTLMPVFDAMGLTTNPIPVKAALELIGHPVGGPRMPLIRATDEQIAQLKDVLTSAGVL
jgi:4-hydroxy-tetrahydrodipicolinate synthase